MNRRSFIGLISATAAYLGFPFKSAIIRSVPSEPVAASTSPFVRIGIIPRIVEDTDRWGMPMGTYSVISGIGYVERERWQELYEFENHDDLGGREENLEVMRLLRENPGITIHELSKDHMPLMKKRIKHSLVEQFNAVIHDPSTVGMKNGIYENEYIRMCAFFNERTLVEWKPEHDQMLKRLQAECDRMNGIA